MAQMEEQIKAPEKIQLSNEEIANLSLANWYTVQNTSNQEVHKTGLSMVEKYRKKMKTMKSEIKENVQGTNSDRKKAGTQINGLEQKEEINSQLEQNEETRIQKNEERLRNLWDIFKHSNIWIIGDQKEKGKSKKLKTYLNK